MKIIYSKTKSDCTCPLFLLSGCLQLHELNILLSCKLVWKLLNRNAPYYILNDLSTCQQTRSTYSLRCATLKTSIPPFANTKIFQGSLFIRACKMWNQNILLNKLNDIKSLSSFSASLKLTLLESYASCLSH